MKSQLDKLNHNGRLIKYISHAITNERNKNLMKFDITAVQEDVLIFLWKNIDKESIYQKDIELHSKLKTPTVTGILKRLEEKDMILRYQDKRDARCTCHKITEKGLSVLEKSFINGIIELEKKLVEGMSEEEKNNLNYLLKKVLDNMEK